jgi:uncharacterized protein YndB with AHSA1/START domain
MLRFCSKLFGKANYGGEKMMGKLHVVAEPGKQEVIMTRMFDAPREKVFRYFTDPEKIKKWWGGKSFKTRIDKMESRAGGSWRFVQTDQDGNEWAFHGVYHDMTPPERCIQTFEFEGWPEPGHVVLDTLCLEDQGTKTKMTIVSVFQSVADRDGMVASGMERGAGEGYDALSELLSES